MHGAERSRPNKKNTIVWWPNMEHRLWHNELSETRITFLRHKDDLGLCFYRFVGVFRLDKEKSIRKNKCVWASVSDMYQLNV